MNEKCIHILDLHVLEKRKLAKKKKQKKGKTNLADVLQLCIREKNCHGLNVKKLCFVSILDIAIWYQAAFQKFGRFQIFVALVVFLPIICYIWP